MWIHELEIENFRGIKEMKWTGIPKGVISLIGPGDSGKTTVLDALETLFNVNYNSRFGENDFYKRDMNNPIKISATIVDPPAPLIQDQYFFSRLRGVDKSSGEIVDEPNDEQPALTLQFCLDADLEPTWEVICDRHSEGKRISYNNRRKCAVRMINAEGQEFRWNRRSSLMTLTDDAASKRIHQALRVGSQEARKALGDQLGPLRHCRKHY